MVLIMIVIIIIIITMTEMVIVDVVVQLTSNNTHQKCHQQTNRNWISRENWKPE